MEIQTFLENFKTVADAPSGIQRLRYLVLRLAVSGHLVEQLSTDDSVASLLSQIDAERPGRSKKTGPTLVESGPFEIPTSWCWSPLGRLVHLEMGQSPPSSAYNQSGEGMPFFQGKADFGSEHPVPRYWCTKPTKVAHAGDVLLSVRAPVGPTNIADQTCCVGRGLAALRPLGGVPTLFIRYLIQAFERDLAALGTGTTFSAISKKNLSPFLVPVPPIAEQKRIVARVGELMGLCDDLEASEEQRHRVGTRFRDSALRSLTAAQTSDDVRKSWDRVSSGWSIVTRDLDSIASLRGSVAQLAVEGRLSSARADDAPADLILDECQRRKAELIAAGGRSRSDLGPVSEAEFEFSLPPGWAVARLDLWCDIAGGLAKGRKLAGKSTVNLPYLRVANVKAGYLSLDEIKEIEVPVDEVEKYSLLTGDVLLTEGGDWDKLGRSAVWTGEIEPCLHQNHVFRARTLSAALRPEWISLFTNSQAGRAYFQSKAKRTTNLASINMTELRSMPLPVPPAAEQVRILNALANLRSQIAGLEDALSQEREVVEGLGAALTTMH